MTRTTAWIAAALLTVPLCAGAEAPGVEAPGMEAPGVEAPGVETPGVEAPGVETSFAVDGLHIDLTFSEALTWASAHGGECSTRQSRTQVGRVRADCSFATCEEQTPAGPCPATDPENTSGNQLVRQMRWVGFEAPAESAPLGRAVIQFEDSPETVAQALKDAFGAPVTDTTAAKKSWSHSTRMGWRAGNRTMGLLTAEHMIVLTAERHAPEPVSP